MKEGILFLLLCKQFVQSYRRRLGVLLFLGFLFLFFPGFLSSQDALSEISLGKEELERKNFKKSIIHFQHAIRLNPNSLEARLGYAKSAQSLGSLQDAKKAYEEVLARSPKKAEAVIGLSEIYLDTKELGKVSPILNPALEEYPNHTGLRITEAKFLEASGKNETAILKLKRISSKLGFPSDVEKMLANLYLSQGMWLDAENSLDIYIQKESSDPYGFFLKAKLLLFKAFASPEELQKSFPLAEEHLNNALQLDDKHEESRFLLAKVKLMKNDFESAFLLLYDLSKEFPENQNYHYWEAILADQVNKTKFSSYHFKRALEKNDLDELARFAAEEYAISREKEEAKLRFYLGNYRKERYIAERSSFYFKSAFFHLHRSRDLIPHSPAIRKELQDFYFQKGDLVSLANLLFQLREEDPQNFALQTKLEATIKTLQNSLEYREGFLDWEKDLVEVKPTSSRPEVFVYDFEPSEIFPEKNNTGKILAMALRYHLKNIQDVRIPSNTERSQILDALEQNTLHPYTKTIPFGLEGLPALDRERKNKAKIRFVVYGNFITNKNRISLDWKLYDRNVARIVAQGITAEEGRDALSGLIARVSDRIKSELPKEGKVLRVKKDGILISLGKKDGMKKDSALEFKKDEQQLGDAEILEIGYEISLVKPKFRNWEKILATGDFCHLPSKEKAKQ